MNHVVVASALTLRAQTVERIPGKRMKPVNGGCQAADQLKTDVPPLDVGQFVEQHEPACRFRPLLCLLRQEDDGPQDAPRHWDQRHRARPQLDPATECKLPSESVEQLQPVLVDDPPGLPPSPFVTDNTRQSRQRDRDEPQHPEKHDPGGFS